MIVTAGALGTRESGGKLAVRGRGLPAGGEAVCGGLGSPLNLHCHASWGELQVKLSNLPFHIGRMIMNRFEA